jgi:hypothetical protein
MGRKVTHVLAARPLYFVIHFGEYSSGLGRNMTSRPMARVVLAMGGTVILYGEPLMKYTGVRENDFTAHASIG